MAQTIPTSPQDCPRCTDYTVCSGHAEYATKERPAAAALLGVVQADAAAVHGRVFEAVAPRPENAAVPEGMWRRLLPWAHHD